MQRLVLTTIFATGFAATAFAQGATPAPAAPKAPAPAAAAPAGAMADMSCTMDASTKKLAGAAKNSFMAKCAKDAKAGCAKDSADKKLAGAAKASFEKKCLADHVGLTAATKAAAAPASQMFMLIGTLIFLPLALCYTAFVYWLFRGKVKAGATYH